ncbi:MAG TPA: HlyD family efflux transporter periplasmic adaptor subunit [Chitinophagaceae bacterium]|nr:HlyD family efflux transporter periplasmic adaptor subunit [Chitinophagaceae bacterium]
MKQRASREIDQLELRSEEVREILGSIPHWTLRFGPTYLLALVLLGLILSWVIKYPDIIQAPVVLTTEVPPVNIMSRNSGYLTLWAKDKQPIKAGEYIGFISNPADTREVLKLINELDSFKRKYYTDPTFLSTYTPPNRLNLGSVQDAYNAFVSGIRNYQFFASLKGHQQKAADVTREIRGYQALSKQQKEQIDIMTRELNLALKQFERDSMLYLQKVISMSEFEQKKKDFLANERAYKNNIANLTNTEIQKTQLTGKYRELMLDEQQQQIDLRIQLETAANALDALLKQWEYAYMLKSPMNGRIALFTYWADNQFVKSSEEILTIIPEQGKYFAQAKTAVTGSGKIKPGQEVNIKLDNYPFEEYGMVTGIVRNISLLPRENQYSINIELDKGLSTSHGRAIEFRQDMSGHAEIITEDLRLLERLFHRLRKTVAD